MRCLHLSEEAVDLVTGPTRESEEARLGESVD
jgi:hypothetical protein